ncbi:ketosteroid isomerase-like protein [Dermacoccus sp. SAI-028]|uniref:nuclear transport factor 2 family protein n=1 Tax=Dermacoccus TaxID=57495 RepID=UPI0009404137|nr:MULTISPECIES: nuclear transport factor 2 family protein [Dermacoccus]TCJ90653.1 ketosteroid isomerase-like protein [Dermacoccus sp. SAI-028]
MQRESRDAHIRRYYEVVDAGDVEGVLDISTDDATYCRPGYEPMAGREALRAFYSGDRVIESGRHSVTSLLIDGDEAFVRGEFNGVLKDGSDAHLEFADFFRFGADDRIAYRQTYFYAPLV